MGRPLKQIDEKLVERLAAIQCTMEEIAKTVGCSVDTLENRFSDTIKAAKQGGKSSLRRRMWRSAQAGSVPMQIWLSKQYLGMREPDQYLMPEEPNKVIQHVSQPITKEEAKRLLTDVSKAS